MKNPHISTECDVVDGKIRLKSLFLSWHCKCGDHVRTEHWNFMTRQCEQCYMEMVEEQEDRWGERPESLIDKAEYLIGDR
jgi:hypothetical protein